MVLKSVDRAYAGGIRRHCRRPRFRFECRVVGSILRGRLTLQRAGKSVEGNATSGFMPVVGLGVLCNTGWNDRAEARGSTCEESV